MPSQVWDACPEPRARRWGGAPAQSRPHHGFFTERSSSFMKPFCSIHLSLRNLDLPQQKPQGPGSAHTEGSTRSSEGGRVPPRPYGPAETPGAGWGCVEAKSWIPEAPTAGSCGRWGIWSTRAGCAQGTGEGSMPGWGLWLAPLAEWQHWTEVSSSNRYKEAIRD